MVAIQWQLAAHNSWYYQYDRFTFKKNNLPTATIFQIWEYGVMRYVTGAEHDFMIKASYVLTMGHFDALV